MTRITRHETLFGKLTELKDASHLIKERKVQSDINIFKVTKVIAEDSIFLGFGKPNVFLGYSEDGLIKKFDAKSLKRQKSKVIDTKGWAQSGLIIEIKNPSKEMKRRIRASAESFVGSSHLTCVNANARVLNRAGFTSNGKDLSGYYFPMSLAKQIVRHGLQFENKSVNFDIVKTVPNYLESFGLSVIKAQWLTFYRHSIRFYKSKQKTNKFLDILNKFKHKMTDSFLKNKKQKPLEEKVVLFPEDSNYRKNIEVSITTPSKIGLGLRMICGPHAFYEMKHSNEEIERMLPNKLKEYEKKKSGLFTYLKKNVLFSKPVVNFIRKHLATTKEVISDSSEKDLFNMIRTDTENIKNKYNLVITSESIYVIKIGIKYKIIDWILSKHVLLSGYSQDVRFAGEFWKDKDGIIFFNNNSGTYAPNKDTIPYAQAILEQAFPNTKIKSKSFD